MIFPFKKNDVVQKRPDLILLAAAAAMVVLGVLILSSASALMSQSRFHDSYYLLRHQILLGILPGLFLGLVAYLIPPHFLHKWSMFLMGATTVLLVMIFIPGIGFHAGGAQRWVNLGFTTIQPSEILKLVFIIYLASWLSTRVNPGRRKKNQEVSFKDRKSTRLNSSHEIPSRMPSSA